MQIRSAIAADIPSIMTLERETATASHWSAVQYESLFSQSPPTRLALLIEEDGVVQGFLVAREIESEWELENIAVALSARRRGFGRELLQTLVKHAHAQEARAIFLEVRKSNLAARSLYESCAFREIGRRKRYYQNPAEDAVTYRLNFQ
ncbi:MAG TPA: ribosomal protein S18-alanine N-acetyltransferase [Terriglobales bacterium]|nr:ribosomal protein S18-alanine N-acetyltransferase [Terriglobales bacterium]